MIKKLKELPEWLLLAIAIIYYFLLSLYKFLQAPLWGDEMTEYYTSFFSNAPIPNVTEAASMHERMITMQQQPPLYSCLIGIWRLIRDTEFWLRFSSVVFCLGSVVAIYFIMRKLANRWFAFTSAIVFSSMYQVQYYVKEAAEYALLLPLLFWVIYCFILVLEKATLKRIIAFTLVCVAAVYTQYGAVFIVVPTALQVLYRCLKLGEKKLFKATLGLYTGAVVLAGIPLVVFFLIPQSINPISTLVLEKTVEFKKNFIYDFFLGFTTLFDWLMLDYDRDGARMMIFMWILAFAMIIISIFLAVRKKNTILNYLLLTTIFTYILYYICNKTKFYAYGWFGTRYCLFFLPLLFIVSAYLLSLVLQELSTLLPRMPYQAAKSLIFIAAVLYCCYGVYRVHNHWWKADERAVVAYWYEHELVNELTFVDYLQRLSYIYYLDHNENYDESYLDSHYINTSLASTHFTEDEWIDYLQTTIWPEGMPERFYLVTGYYNTLVQTLEKMGYHAEPIIDYTSDLFLMTK
ncbi:MAG: glycosyltransferase family 39 protein [Lachnospiraceae bacterium]|nr:glycosyltransferase family 39 protein [Lachnospiraceae bacterium]